MKKSLNLMALMGVGLMLGGVGVPALEATPTLQTATAQAAKKTGYQRISKDKMNSRYQYKVKNKKGKTYKISGPAKNVKLKTNHYLKNYTHKKWTRTKITQVKHKGHWMVYYYMKSNAKNKAAGWVKLTDMQVTKPHANKGGKHESPDFDTWYKRLNQSQRDRYMYAYGNMTLDYQGDQVPDMLLL